VSEDSAEKLPEAAPAIRSFVLRAGRMGSGQQRAMDELGPRFIVPFTPSVLDLAATFGRDAPCVLEIGFGMGQATAQIAAALPDTNFIAIEVHPPGVGALLKLIGEQGLTNLRLIRDDAVEVLDKMIAPASLADLARRAFILGVDRHCATDWQPYAEQMLEVLSAEPALRNCVNTGYAPRPDYRPLTKFEARGLQLGHGVWDLVFTPSTPPSRPTP